jgi:predicted DNA-binding ribbon-helix-helix protein
MSQNESLNEVLGMDPAQDPSEWLASLKFDPDSAVSDSVLPPTSAELEKNMITTSLKLPEEMRERLRELAGERAVTVSMLIRQFIELGLAAEQPGRMIPLSDAIRVLASLRAAA